MSLEEFEAINQQFIEAKKALIERERILSVMASIDDQLATERKMLPRLIARKKFEQHDVTDLEDFTLKSIFYMLLRNHEAQLDIEVQEYLEAKIEVEKCQMRITSLETHLEELEIHLIDLADYDDVLEELHQAQIQLIASLNLPEAKQIESIANSLPNFQAKYQQYKEAHEIGKRALENVNLVVDILQNNKTIWGTWKRHPSLFSTYDPINTAIDLSLETQPFLNRFQQELRDISLHFWSSPDMETPKRPDDPIFILVTLFGVNFPDPVNQSRMNKWVTHLQQLRRQISLKIEMIENELSFLQNKIKKQEKVKRSLLNRLWHESSFS